MHYTIKQVGEKTDLSISTIRYYEKEGLLSAVDRDEVGRRLFSNEDIEQLSLISCLRSTGMPISKIREYLNGCDRVSVLEEHRENIDRQLDELKRNRSRIDCKIAAEKQKGRKQ